MKLTLLALVVAAALFGCNVGESTAEKPDPARFLPKGGTAGGPPPTTPPTGN